MRILIIDDDRSFRKLLSEFLGDDHDVSVLADGHNALAVLADPGHNFDLVILDQRMPRCNGSDVLQALEEWPNLRQRVAIVTGDRDAAARHYPEQVVSVWEKPIRLSEFGSWVNKFAHQQGAHVSRRPVPTPA